ncbi:hypothetical protein N9112_00365 [bacterium]|nr:hypothetical protein [bacterium]
MRDRLHVLQEGHGSNSDVRQVLLNGVPIRRLRGFSYEGSSFEMGLVTLEIFMEQQDILFDVTWGFEGMDVGIPTLLVHRKERLAVLENAISENIRRGNISPPQWGEEVEDLKTLIETLEQP